jgi:hypothetical protein
VQHQRTPNYADRRRAAYFPHRSAISIYIHIYMVDTHAHLATGRRPDDPYTPLCPPPPPSCVVSAFPTVTAGGRGQIERWKRERETELSYSGRQRLSSHSFPPLPQPTMRPPGCCNKGDLNPPSLHTPLPLPPPFACLLLYPSELFCWPAVYT